MGNCQGVKEELELDEDQMMEMLAMFETKILGEDGEAAAPQEAKNKEEGFEYDNVLNSPHRANKIVAEEHLGGVLGEMKTVITSANHG